MSEEQRENEEIRQEKIEAGVGKIVPGAGRRGTPRRMAQMVSVRLDGELIGKLRTVAKQRGVTLSDLLREGAEIVAEGEYPEKTRIHITNIHGADPQRVASRPEEEVYALN